VRRLAAALARRLVVLAIVATGVFALVELAEGDAVDAWLAATGGDAGLAAAMRTAFGLDGTVAQRYVAYLAALATLDLGTSVAFGRPVAAVLAERLPVTLALGGAALVLSATAGTLLGLLCARRGGAVDAAVGGATLALNATPGFVVALVLGLVFAVRLGWLPVGGLASLRPPAGSAAMDVARHLVLPVATLTLVHLAPYVRVARAGARRAAGSEAVRFARAKGLRGWRLGWRHVVRPSLAPVVALAGVQAGALLGGSVVVETVFAVPGYGSLAAAAVAARDTVLLAGVVLAGAVVVMAASLLADAAARRIDPRLGR
jgi:peptide/nickel transport system permease protein